ncbi:Predicted flavoprotein CzcO associated with the cation diffusion facilitator CzcD [Chelatococcus sambhunathii]|uniref:Predicted flavoprotein CzcO associated with the cation diffusion facilitator CzcD n=1 Tax=Chelatococcus sambhunathii TaxID=363953 RepID=A0ABM9U1Y6_9HYPH|nr:NAD(P)-binding domain-containing protein [Chelatococcus sambhunathii]CUA86147.1 Predicted flavoprotein CzcO associated with the cation diffusion facilitator CzcD [Chelatococcus sambhunathii]
MRYTDIVIIGAGQAGLAMSHCLSARGIDHVVLERGRVGERWRSERWDSLRLLTPNWMTRLPGGGYDGPDPDGFMTMPETVRFLENYAQRIAAPVESGVDVRSARRVSAGYRIVTDAGEWAARGLVIATGHCDLPRVPAMASRLARHMAQVVPRDYRRADQLPEGGVLVLGASASGIQLAEEIHASGRPVTLSVGHHTRLPRRYRGHDILWWLDRLGSLRKAKAEMHPHATLREEPSLQLVGSSDHRSIDLAILQRRGVQLVGRAIGACGRRMRFAGDLSQTTAAADLRLIRILNSIDEMVENGTFRRATAHEPAEPILLHDGGAEIDLDRAGIRTVVWATGYRRSYPWLHMPVLDARGEIVHDGGICPLAGLYVLGLHFMRRRNSSFIDGVGADAEALAAHIACHLGVRRRTAA